MTLESYFQIVHDFPEADRALKGLKKEMRAKLRIYGEDFLARPILRTFKQMAHDPWRSVCHREGEYWTEYCIVTDADDLSDADLHEICDELRRVIHSPWDCTGQAFTVGVDARRVPLGILFIHHLALDV